MSLRTPSPTQSPEAHTHNPETMVPDASRGERTRSYAVADFPLPNGREEEWRFTPLDRLGSLLRDEATGACLDWEDHLPEGVMLSTMSVQQWQHLGAPKPADRA